VLDLFVLTEQRNNEKISQKPNGFISGMKVVKDINEVLTVAGRNQLTNENEVIPFLLNKKSYLLRQYAEHIHRINFHASISTIVSKVSRSMWCVDLRNLIREITRSCIQCRKYSSQRYQPPMSNFPPDRISKAGLFVNVSLDVVGPFRIKRWNKGEYFKVYGLIVVCKYSKGVHIEILTDHYAVAFISALKCMFARRGTPATIFSDQGTNMRAASLWFVEDQRNEVSEEITKVLSPMGVSWVLTPVDTPHRNG
jgi:hypothetical protein